MESIPPDVLFPETNVVHFFIYNRYLAYPCYVFKLPIFEENAIFLFPIPFIGNNIQFQQATPHVLICLNKQFLVHF